MLALLNRREPHGQRRRRRQGRRAPRGEDERQEQDHRNHSLISRRQIHATVAAQAPIVVLLTYFLLASGAHFRRKLVQLVGPSLSRKKDAVHILEEIDAQVQRYLLAVLATNAVLGVATWLAFLALGLDQPAVWGVAANVLA